MEPAIREDSGRNPDGTFKPGISGNPSGRPKNTLKDYVRQKFYEMSDDEKEAFLKTVDSELQWRMGEGNPPQKLEGDPDKPFIQIIFDSAFQKNETSPSPKNDN